MSIRETANAVTPIVGQVSLAAKERLAKRVQELTGGPSVGSGSAHAGSGPDSRSVRRHRRTHPTGQSRGAIPQRGKEGSPLGRKLDFLLQELHREVNTLGSKSVTTDIAAHVVNMKTELEKYESKPKTSNSERQEWQE